MTTESFYPYIEQGNHRLCLINHLLYLHVKDIDKWYRCIFYQPNSINFSINMSDETIFDRQKQLILEEESKPKTSSSGLQVRMFTYIENTGALKPQCYFYCDIRDERIVITDQKLVQEKVITIIKDRSLFDDLFVYFCLFLFIIPGLLFTFFGVTTSLVGKIIGIGLMIAIYFKIRHDQCYLETKEISSLKDQYTHYTLVDDDGALCFVTYST